jgi:CheY-like chemotaxis protein
MSTLVHALIIDDDAFNLEVLQRLLAAEHLSSTAVQDVNELQSAINSAAQIDVLFLDLEMPRMDGYKVFAVLRNRLGTQTPIIACTVHSNEMSSVRELGFQGFISKPLDHKRFPGLLKSILGGEQVWDS